MIGQEEGFGNDLKAPMCRMSTEASIAPLLAIAVAMALLSTSRSGLGHAASQSSWRFGLVDDWGLPVSEARAYLYNSTGASYADWELIGWGDADGSGNVTIHSLPSSWNSSCVPGIDLEYRLVVKMKVNGSASPITLCNVTVLSLPFAPTRTAVRLGSVLNGSAAYSSGPYGLPPNQWGRFRLRLFYVAFKAVDERGYPLPVTEVHANFCSDYGLGPSNGTLITNEVVPPWIDSPVPLVSPIWREPITNGSCGGEFETLDPLSPNTGPAEFGGVGWIIVRIPAIQQVSGADSSLVKNLSLILKYRGTVVGNFTATRWLSPTGGAWVNGVDIDGRLDSDDGARTLDAELQGNGTHVVVCSVRWVYVNLFDQNHNGWPTRSAKLTLYDYDIGSTYPWPGAIVPIDPYTPPNFNPSRVLVRYPSINTSIKVVVTWYDVTVNVTLFESDLGQSGGMLIPGRPGSPDLANPSNSEPDGVGNFDLYSDMVRVRLKLLSSGQLPEPLEPYEVDEIEFQLRSEAVKTPTHCAKLSYWHGYVAIPDSPLAWLLASPAPVPYGVDETTAATGWLPNGSRSAVDIAVRYGGSEVLDTARAFPFNSTISLRCPGFVDGIPIVDPALTDYDRTLVLYAGIYDVGFRVLIGDSRENSSASDVALFVTLPSGERRTIWTDGNGIATLRCISAGNYSGFVILYKMRPLNASNVGPNGIRVDGNSKRMFELLFPAYDLNLTIWNFRRTFKLINVNVSFYSTVNLSQCGITNDALDRILSSRGSGGSVLPEGWEILQRLPSATTKSPIVQYRTSSWSTNSTWPLRVQLMPPANYTIRVSAPNGSGARGAGFRDADANATLYWSMDPWGKSVVLLDRSISVDVITYVYDPRITTLDASGIPLCLFENSAIILAEPYSSANGTSGLLWHLQQKDAEMGDYNAYLVRFNSSATNVFHSFNASRGLNDTDIAFMNPAINYPQQSRYLIGSGNLSSPKYRFIVYYRGVLVFNGSMKLSNPYVSEESVLVTSAYSYVFRVLNNPPSNNSFTIPNLQVDVMWAGLRTSYWPAVNLTRGEAIDEFALLNSTKLHGGFDVGVVKRMWGPPPSNESIELLPYERFSPYFSSYMAIEGDVTDANGEVQAVVPIWNDSSRIFGTPAYVNVRTIPGITAGVPLGAGAALVGMMDQPRTDLGDTPWSGRYPPWQGSHGANLTGLVDNSSATAFGLSRSKGIGLLPNGTRQSPMIVRVAANDLTIIVKDASGNSIPHQRIDIVSDALSLHLVLFTGSEPLSLSSSRSFILWGTYGYAVSTVNLTDPNLVYAWQLYGMQWLAKALTPTWSSQVLVLQWPAQLTIQAFAGDGSTPLERAWVLVSYGTNAMIDGNTGKTVGVVPGTNVTASMTDAQGFAAGVVHTDEGTLPLSLNLFMATYLVRVYYSVRGSPDIVGPVNGLLVYDSLTDEPQHRYLYLGIEPPDSSGVDWSPAQFRIARTCVWSLRVRLVSQSGRAIAGARVRITQLGMMYDLDPIINGACATTSEGNAWMGLVPAGTATIEAEWRSPFSSEPTSILRTPVSIDGNTELTLRTSVHDLELKLVGQGGDPIAGAQVSIAALEGGTMSEVGVTDSNGTVRILYVPSGTYRVEAMWHGVDVSPDALAVSASRRYFLTARNVGKLVVHVAGVLGQGLSDSQVDVWKGGILVFSGKANGQGYVSALLPFGEYYVRARHSGLEAIGLVTLSDSSTALQISVGEIATLFGMGLTPVSTAIFFATMAALILAICVLITEYVIWRRKRIPQLFR